MLALHCVCSLVGIKLRLTDIFRVLVSNCDAFLSFYWSFQLLVLLLLQKAKWLFTWVKRLGLENVFFPRMKSSVALGHRHADSKCTFIDLLILNSQNEWTGHGVQHSTKKSCFVCHYDLLPSISYITQVKSIICKMNCATYQSCTHMQAH